MCKAFSCIVTKKGAAYWKAGVDAHESIIEAFKVVEKDTDGFVRAEISPSNNDYLRPKSWTFKVDEDSVPDWFSPKHRESCWQAFRKWKRQVYSAIRLREVRKPVHPFKIKPPRKITEKHLKLLREWASVKDSVGASVWDSVRGSVWASVKDSVWDSVGASVGASVRGSVWASVWDSVWASVGASVWDSVYAYIGSLFPKIKEWEYVNHSKPPFNRIKGYPFQSAVKLWKMGLVPSFGGKKGRLHGGPDGRVLWEGTLKEASL